LIDRLARGLPDNAAGRCHRGVPDGLALAPAVPDGTETDMTYTTRRGGAAAAAALALAAGVATALTPAAAATAVGKDVGTINGVESRCHGSVYSLCLYFNSNRQTAWWGTQNHVSNLAGAKFFNGGGDGSGQNVKNNAAAVGCDAPATACYVYFNSNYGGDFDYLPGRTSGQLSYTYNENASVDIVF
jgi:hypothetical protein